MNYFDILCEEYPKFIDKYLATEEMQRLKKIGYFCGADYTPLQKINKWYSRYDHSKAVALMAYHFTHDKTQTLLSLFHDLGTPCYSHVIDYLLNDSEKQESSEKDVYEIIKNSDTIKRFLKADKVNLEDLKDIKKYSVIENERPKICTDRLDSIFKICELWVKCWTVKDIKYFYDDMCVLVNEEGNKEIGFKTKKICQKFFKGVYKSAIKLQKNEDKFAMQFLADLIKYAINENIITFDDLYILSEEEINNRLRKPKTFLIFEKLKKVKSSNNKPKCYYVSVKSKRKYVLPLVKINNEVVRINSVHKKSHTLLVKLLAYEDLKYTYSPKIKEIN